MRSSTTEKRALQLVRKNGARCHFSADHTQKSTYLLGGIRAGDFQKEEPPTKSSTDEKSNAGEYLFKCPVERSPRKTDRHQRWAAWLASRNPSGFKKAGFKRARNVCSLGAFPFVSTSRTHFWTEK
jgi:hypothetical protein